MICTDKLLKMWITLGDRMKKKESRLEIRIDEKDYLLLQVQASKANMNVSEYLRMWIDKSIRPLKDKILNGEINYEDCKTFLDDKLQS